MTLPWITAVNWEAWGASAGGLEGVKTWGRGGLSEATEEGEECPSGSVLTLSSDIRILMLIRTSTQTLPSHCGRCISHFPQGSADSSKLLSLVQMGRFISTGSFLWGQDFSWNTSQISLLLFSVLLWETGRSTWREKLREGGGRLRALPFTSCGNTSTLLIVAGCSFVY